jgi:hypothetical protein
MKLTMSSQRESSRRIPSSSSCWASARLSGFPRRWPRTGDERGRALRASGLQHLHFAPEDFIPDKVRIPAYVVIIASFVTMVEMTMQAFMPPLYKNLGVYVPLIGSTASSRKGRGLR